MIWSLAAIGIGYLLDLFLGDPRAIPHPVVMMGRLISRLEKTLRRLLPKNPGGEKIAGGLIWLIVVFLAALIPSALLWLCHRVSPWLRLGVESVMCWQILATKSLKQETMKVYSALKHGTIKDARYAVSMIVGRDTKRLDQDGVTRAAVETVAENTSDGIVAPLFFLALGGGPLGMVYKAVNTMDSMLGYIEPPYKHIGLIPAKMDDVFNYLPARLSAWLMLLAGRLMRLDHQTGLRIYRRDRKNHASPNSAQTESVCAGLLRIRLAGDAWYHGQLHRKPYIGDDLRPISPEDIPLTCRLMVLTAFLALITCVFIKLSILILIFVFG